MRRRGLYKHLITGDVWWLLYELDGHVNVQSRATGKVERMPGVMFDLLYHWHRETT